MQKIASSENQKGELKRKTTVKINIFWIAQFKNKPYTVN